MDQHEAELNRFLLFEHNQVNVLLPTRTTVSLGFYTRHYFSLGFCCGHIYNSPNAVLLNTCNHSSNSNILLSTMAVTDLLVGGLCVPLSAVVGLLVSYQILADLYICVLDFVAIWSTVTLTIRFVRFSIWQWWHGKGTWPFENWLTTKWWWLKALWKSWR